MTRKASAILLALTLAACTAASDNLPPLCPETAILDDAGRVTRFVAGPGRDIIDIDFQAEMTALTGECIYDIDEETGAGAVNLEMLPEFRITRGAANKTRRADFEYFVSLIDARGQVVEKQLFPFGIDFSRNQTTIVDNDAPLEMTIPLTAGEKGTDYSVLIGFQISGEELDYNRKNWQK